MKTKNTVEKLVKSKEIILLDEFITRKHGLGAKVGLLKADWEALEMDKALTEKKGKKIKQFVNAILWLIFRCQKTGIKANAIVHLEAVGFPPLAMGCYPWNSRSKESVLVISRVKGGE